MEVRINGQYVELGDSSPAITRKSIDINNPSLRFIDITNKFQLPYTNETAKLLDNPASIGSNNRALDKFYKVTIEDIFKIFSGKGFVDGITKDKFNLQVVDESSDLFKALDVKLNTINWDDCDTYLTQAAIAARESASITNCWVWGKLCLHEIPLQENTDQSTGDARCTYSRPSLYMQALLKKVIELQGYSYLASTLDLAFSCWHSAFYFSSYQKTIDTSYTSPCALDALNTNDFAHADLTVISGSINIGTKKTSFRLRGTVVSDAVVTMIVRGTDNVDPTKITESQLIIGIGTQAVDFYTSEFYSDNGMTIDIRFETAGTVTVDAILYTLLNDKDFDLSTNPFLGYMIKAYDNLPDLTYFDLYRTMCIVANQTHTVDVLKKTFDWLSLANINKNNSVDWSEKFVMGSENTVSSFSGVFQKNWLKYSNDITVNPQLGWDFFSTDNESLATEGDYLVLKFGASNDVTIATNSISHVKVYSDTTRLQNQVPNIRLFKISGTKLQFDPISWSNLKANYYLNWFTALYRIRLITCECALSKLDVLSWQPKQLVYIDYFKTVFIVLEISNFIPGKKTKVKLLGYGR